MKIVINHHALTFRWREIAREARARLEVGIIGEKYSAGGIRSTEIDGQLLLLARKSFAPRLSCKRPK